MVRFDPLGRVAPIADRYVVTNKGVAELQERFGWRTFWWHGADGILTLARRLEVPEMAYKYLPLMWQSNLVRSPRCHVFREWEDTAWLTQEPVTRANLVETDWSKARLVGFYWFKAGPFEAVAIYQNDNRDDGFLCIPVLWRGSFQKPKDITGVRQDMEKVLVRDSGGTSCLWRRASIITSLEWLYSAPTVSPLRWCSGTGLRAYPKNG